MVRSQQHTAHTHTTDLKPSIAPIEAPSSAPPLLTSSRERVATDNVKAPPQRSVPKGAHNKRTRAVPGGGLQRQKVWPVMVAGGGKRGVNTTISQKRDAQGTGHRSAKTATAVRAVAAATVEARVMATAYAVVRRSEATAAMMTTTTTTMTMTTTTTTTIMTAAETSVEAAAMVTAEARANATVMAAANATATAATMVFAAAMVMARVGCVEGN
jgi:hypothetical protein